MSRAVEKPRKRARTRWGTRAIGLVALTMATLAATASGALADWSGDGKTDVLTVDSSGNLYTYRGNGTGGWVTGNGEWLGNGWDQAPSIVQPGDWDGDGKLDLIAVKRDANLYLFRGNGTGGFITGNAEQIGDGWDRYQRIVAPGDWDGDGNPDLLAVRIDGNLYLYRGNGEGRFITGNPEWIGNGFNTALSLVTAGDWDGDGASDLLAVKSDGNLYMYRGNGTGGFITGNGEVIGAGWFFAQIAAPGDFSGDGKPDLLATDGNGRLLLYRGNGTGGFATGNAETIGTGGWLPLRTLSGPPTNTLVTERTTAATTFVPDDDDDRASAAAGRCRARWFKTTFKNVFGLTLAWVRQEIHWCWQVGSITKLKVFYDEDTPGPFWSTEGSMTRQTFGGRGSSSYHSRIAQKFRYCPGIGPISGCVQEKNLTNAATVYADGTWAP